MIGIQVFIMCVMVITVAGQDRELFDDFRQILPRGGIPAIVNPDYASADTAKISDTSWVLGVVINGQSRAFSLNLLNNFEVVNDKIDSVSYAAVW